MAITVDPLTDGDFAVITAADNMNASYVFAGQWSMGVLNTSSQVEGSGCSECRVDAGIGSWRFNSANQNLENVHLRCWAKLAQSISAGATYGARLMIGTETNHGTWIVYDEDKQVIVYNGWMAMVADPRRPFDAVVGTAPSDILANPDHGIRIDFVDGNGKALPVADMLWYGNEVSIEGGTTGARGTFAEWASDDRTNGYGILRDVAGVYFMNAAAVFQGVGTATSYFQDQGRLVIFEDLPVSGSLYKFRHVGNATGTNHFQMGVATGSGINKEGSNGGVIRAGGAAPWRIECIDTNVDVAHYFGVNMIGPTALYDSALRNVKEDDGGTFTDITPGANGGPGRTDQRLLPVTQAQNDAVYFGHDERFYSLSINLVTAKGGTWTGTWEYYNGSSWVSLTDLTDETGNFATTGAATVDWAVPDDWATTAIDSDTRYWVRFRISSFTSSGTAPVQESNTDGTSCAMSGDIRAEDPAMEIISCSLQRMGSIRVRNGAFLKKCTIDNSQVSAKHGALDLGSTEPTANTVRDLVIQNCRKGILYKGTTTPGPVDFTLTNITFANNNLCARVYDFDSGEAVGSQYFDVTDAANETEAVQFLFFVGGPAAGDALYIGSEAPFSEIHFRINNTDWVATIAFEYWNGTSWTAFSGLSDGTSNFTLAGKRVVSWTRPTNWARKTEGDAGSGTDTQFFMRCRIATFTSSTIVPNSFYIQIPGDIRVDFPSTTTINITLDGTTFLASGSIPQIDNVNGSTVNVINTVDLVITGLSRGTAVKVLSTETAGTVTEGDLISEGFTSIIDATYTVSLNYEEAFTSSGATRGLGVLIRARNQGIFWECAQEDNSGGTFTDYTREMSTNAADDAPAFPATPGVNDAFYFCYGSLTTPDESEWNRIKINVTTAMSASGTTLVWEYWDGGFWTALSNVVDGTNNFTTLGENIVSWDPQVLSTDNAPVSGLQMAQVRVRISVLGTISTVPVFGRGSVDAIRFIPFEGETSIEPEGGTFPATWNEDTISSF